MVRCGIIGFGKMGKIRAHALEKSGRAQVVAVYDIVDIEDCPYPVMDSPESVIDADLDAVFVCTPNYQITPLVKESLKKGRHVFAEKPPGVSLEEAEAMRTCETEHSPYKLMFGFNHRHHGSIMKMKEIIDSGEMGKLLWMRGRYGKEVNNDFFKGWRTKKELAGGGILLDQGIHMLDLFRYFAKDFDEVKAFVSNLYWKLEGLEDNAFVILRNSETGVSASLHSTMTQWRYIFSLEVFLEEGALVLNGLKTSSGAYGDEDLAIKKNSKGTHDGNFDSEQRINYRIDHSWDSEINHFLDCIENDDRPALGNSDDAVEIMKLIDKIYKDSQYH